MSVLEEVLLEEYNRSSRIQKAIAKEQENLPKGSIQIKHISNKEYPYLVYREGKKVVSRYLRQDEAADVAAGIKKRRENREILKELEKNIKMIEKTLGKEYIDEHTK